MWRQLSAEPAGRPQPSAGERKENGSKGKHKKVGGKAGMQGEKAYLSARGEKGGKDRAGTHGKETLA